MSESLPDTGQISFGGWKLNNPVAVGDKVVVEKHEQGPMGQIVTFATALL